jgi:hypothetical protein
MFNVIFKITFHLAVQHFAESYLRINFRRFTLQISAFSFSIVYYGVDVVPSFHSQDIE